MKYIYGPVPSRRLGFSLGVDLVPYKTCSFDCIYCQLGKTTERTIARKEYFKKEEVLQDIRNALSIDKQIDYITFSGSGEPTLNSGIGWLIRKVKNIRTLRSVSLPLAVLTNSSFLWDKSLREDLLPADLVVPSLDAATQSVFEAINRPHQSLNIDKIVEGIKKFRQEFKNNLWLEIMLVKGVNDSKDEIKGFKNLISEIHPDKVHLNTVVRPPTEKFARPLSIKELDEIRDFFGESCEVITPKVGRCEPSLAPSFDRSKFDKSNSEDIEHTIIELIRRRPVTLSDIHSSLGIHRNELIKYLEVLEGDKKIKKIDYEEVTYYEYK